MQAIFLKCPLIHLVFNFMIVLCFLQNNFTAPRMVLSASGVNHIDLLAIAEPLFSDLPKITATRAPNFEYIGGDWRQSNDSPVSCLSNLIYYVIFP